MKFGLPPWLKRTTAADQEAGQALMVREPPPVTIDLVDADVPDGWTARNSPRTKPNVTPAPWPWSRRAWTPSGVPDGPGGPTTDIPRCIGGDKPRKENEMAFVRETNTSEAGLPSADWETVSFTGDGTAFNRSFRYVHRKHTLKDILRPGYFNPEPTGKKQYCVTVQRWDEISFCVGGPKPCDATRGLLVVEDHKGWPKKDVIVGLVYRDKTTAAGHNGTATKAEDMEREAA